MLNKVMSGLRKTYHQNVRYQKVKLQGLPAFSAVKILELGPGRITILYYELKQFKLLSDEDGSSKLGSFPIFGNESFWFF